MPTQNRADEQRAWTWPENQHSRPAPVLHQPATFAEAEARRAEIAAELRRLQAITSDPRQSRDARQRASSEIARLAEERASLIPVLHRLREEEKRQRQQARRAAVAALAGAEPLDLTSARGIASGAVALLERLAAEERVAYSEAEQAFLVTARQALIALAAEPIEVAPVEDAQTPAPVEAAQTPASVEAAQARLGDIKHELAIWRPQAEPGQGTFYTRQDAKRRIDALHVERARLRTWLREHEGAWRAERQRQLLDGATQAIALNDGQPVSLEQPASVLHAAHLLLRHLPTAGRMVYSPPEQFIVDALRQVLRASDTDAAGLTAALVEAAGRYPHPATLPEAHAHLDLVRERLRVLARAPRS